MKFRNNYISLWLLLSLSLILIVLIAFTKEEVKIADHSLKKAPFPELFKENNPDIDELSDSTIIDEVKEDEIIKTDSLPQRIFIFGDSMTFNLALRLAQYAKKNGHEIHSVNWDSSNTKIWADYDTLAYFLNKYRPTQVFISLGSNEIYLKNPEIRRPYVKKILEVIDTIPYVWIGPPNWSEDSGINDMIESECKKGSFFKSAGMTFKRKSDHIHPTRESSADWIDSLMRWLPKSSHPFIAETPDSVMKTNPNIIFLKAVNK